MLYQRAGFDTSREVLSSEGRQRGLRLLGVWTQPHRRVNWWFPQRLELQDPGPTTGSPLRVDPFRPSCTGADSTTTGGPDESHTTSGPYRPHSLSRSRNFVRLRGSRDWEWLPEKRESCKNFKPRTVGKDSPRESKETCKEMCIYTQNVGDLTPEVVVSPGWTG